MINLMHGDCLELMKDIPDNSIDMVLTDPPYGTTACKWDTVIDFDLMWAELKRITKDNGAICLFGSEPFSSHLRLSNLKMFKYDWVWEKHKPSNFALAKKQPMRYHELISVFYKKQVNYIPQMIPRVSSRVKQSINSGYVGFNTNGDELSSLKSQNKKDFKNYDPNKKLPSLNLKINAVQSNSKEKVAHPTQKPVALLEYLIKTYTLENETVLDFTMGSGSTGVAAKNLNRKFIGIEKDDKYFKIAGDRINE